MVVFITGKSGAGKTTLANKLKVRDSVILDGDDFRIYFPTGYSLKEKEEHIEKMGRTAALLEKQGFLVIVSAILPTKKLRKTARSFCKDSFLIYLPGGSMWEGTEYETPENEELCLILS